MGDFSWKILADGQLPNADAAIYTVGADLEVAIRQIRLTNISGGSVTISMSIEPSGGVARVIIDEQVLADKNTRVTGGFTLEAGDAIRGDDGGAGGVDVDFVITGAEEDIS